MRIWIVNHYATSFGDPGGTRHASLAKGLALRGHDVLVVAASFDHLTKKQRFNNGKFRATRQSIDGVKFLWLPTPSYGSNGLMRLLNMALFSLGAARLATAPPGGAPDVVVGSSPHPLAALAALHIARKAGCPFVLEVRDLWPESLVELAGLSLRHPLVLVVAGMVRRLYESADRIVTLMPGGAAAIAARSGRRDGVTWIPNGIDLSMLPEAREPPGDAGFTLMYAGAHGMPNALDDLLDAAGMLLRRGRSDVRIRLVGEGEQKERLKRRALDEQLVNVTFEDAVPKTDVYRLLQEADAFVATMMPSPIYRYGISFNKLFDYLASGRPIVFASAAINDPISDAQAGITVEAGDPTALADAIATIADSTPEERRAMGSRGRHYVASNFSTEALVGAYEDLFRELRPESGTRVRTQ